MDLLENQRGKLYGEVKVKYHPVTLSQQNVQVYVYMQPTTTKIISHLFLISLVI